MKEKFLIIAGTFKSGTSSLFTYLNQIDTIEGSSIKETGFFVPAKYDMPIGDQKQYLSYFKSSEDSNYFMEASPGYLYGGKKIADALRERLGPNTKIVFLLRNPVERFISFYKMLSHANVVDIPSDVSEQKLSLQQYIDACKNYIGNNDFTNEKSDYVYNGLMDGAYVSFLKEWFHVFGQDNIRIVFFDDLTHQPKQTCAVLLEWLKLEETALNNVSFRPVNQFRESKSKVMQRIAMRVNKLFESFFRRNERFKQKLVVAYERLNTKKNVQKDNLYFKETKYLKDFYAAHNSELHVFLKEKGYTKLPDWN